MALTQLSFIMFETYSSALQHTSGAACDQHHCHLWSAVPAGRSLEEYNRLLHVVIVGGGPTGVEVAGELSNLINRDLKRIYPDRAKAMR